MPEELWTEVCDIVQEIGIKTIPKKKKCKKKKKYIYIWLSEEALKIAVKRREVKSKGEKERYTHLSAELQRIARRDKKAFLSDQRKEIEETIEWGKTRDFSKKMRDSEEIFHAKMRTIKDRNGMDLTEAEKNKRKKPKQQQQQRRGGKNTQKNCTKKIFTTQMIMMVRSLT